MKKSFTLLFIAGILFPLFSCNKDAIDDLSDDLSRLQDSISAINRDYNAKMDSLIRIQSLILSDETQDIKAFKISQVWMLFESIARQPEASESLIKATEILYTDYHQLLPLSDKAVADRGRARGMAVGGLFTAIARQPEAVDILDAAAEQFLGAYDPAIFSVEMMEYARITAATALMESITRLPEAIANINYFSSKYLNYTLLEGN